MFDVSAPTESRIVDSALAAAIDQARAAAVDMAGAEVGEHLSVRAESELAATHAFAATLPGYLGWYWAVTMVRAPNSAPTVAEVVLLPGEGSLLAQPWVPWSERLQPGDLSPGDLLPTAPDDPRLVPGYLASDDPQVEEVAFELGLGRIRVLSELGRIEAAERWYAGEQGPETAMARQAPAHCGTCGFFVSLAGSLRAGFGACANAIAGTDGRVVSVEFGCGAHSETVAELVVEESGEIYEDEIIDLVPRESAEQVSVEQASVEQASAEQVSVEQASGSVMDLVEPTAQLIEQVVVEPEPNIVESLDSDRPADAGKAEDESGGLEFVEANPTELDSPTTVLGGIEEPAAGNAGQDIVG